MPRWLTTFLVLLILFAFVLPDPVRAGNAVGNAIDSTAVFFQSAGNELSDTVALSDEPTDLAGEASSGSARAQKADRPVPSRGRPGPAGAPGAPPGHAAGGA